MQCSVFKYLLGMLRSEEFSTNDVSIICKRFELDKNSWYQLLPHLLKEEGAWNTCLSSVPNWLPERVTSPCLTHTCNPISNPYSRHPSTQIRSVEDEMREVRGENVWEKLSQKDSGLTRNNCCQTARKLKDANCD